MTAREALLEAAMTEDLVERVKAVNGWVDDWLVTLEGEFDLNDPTYFALDQPGKAQHVAVRNAGVFKNLVELLTHEGRENGVLWIGEIQSKKGVPMMRTRLQLVRQR